ncbi:MAG TPA: adenylate/guanylate cyclase domain-containing protein, partial [Ktedonobacterales bacterium]|nr:adenylate/guanylate cyclase domain-containing protein [Ktedonobacterales bacterium]
MPELPTGTVTLFFTDLEGSTRLLQHLGGRYAEVLAEMRRVLRFVFSQWQGHEVDTQGDAFFVVFARATDAVAAAVACQRALAQHPWPEGLSVRVRIGLHTGEPQLTADGYIGVAVHQAARIMSAAHGGQILLSQTTRDLVEADLPEGVALRDLGDHRLKDLHRPSHLWQLLLTDLPADFPPLKTLDTHPNNLPIQPTPFIGREKEMAAVCGLLRRPEVRLLTLTGTGGVGKTRLGLQVAAELSDLFADGVFLVPLAPVSAPEQVLPTIAQTLSIGEYSDQPLFSLLQGVLKDKHLLLLLDNFEQVAAAAVVVADLLTACPSLKVLVTSRVALHVRAEQEFAVPPLALPRLTSKQQPDSAALSQYEAVALFIARALAVKPEFEVTNTNAPAVAEICTRLDGLPLAIELAAARIKHFPPHTLLTRLEQGLGILSGGARDLPARQQTLRGALAWSYDLLSAEEQALFRRFAVFVDGGTIEAAEQVCQAAGSVQADLLDGLASLVDKSLLRQEEQGEGEARFLMLQTLREFGLERLAEHGELEATRQAHAQYYLALVEAAEPHLQRAEQARWLSRLDQEQENVRAALSWLLAGAARSQGQEGVPHAEHALSLCIGLFPFWDVRGTIREGQTWLEQALTYRAGVAVPIQARALYAAAQLALYLDETGRAEVRSREGLNYFREVGDPAGIADGLEQLAAVAWASNQYAAARTQYEEAEQLYQRAGNTWEQGRCLTQLARIALAQGEYARARTRLEEAERLYQPLGVQERLAWVRHLQAKVFLLTGDNLARAQRLGEQAVALARAGGFKPYLA